MILYRLLFFVREAFQGIKNNGFIHLVATGTIAFSLLTFGIFILTVINLDRIFDDWGKRMQVIVYLEVESTDEAISAAKESISRLPQTERVTYISKEQSLKTLKKSLQSQADILDSLDDKPSASIF